MDFSELPKTLRTQKSVKVTRRSLYNTIQTKTLMELTKKRERLIKCSRMSMRPSKFFWIKIRDTCMTKVTILKILTQVKPVVVMEWEEWTQMIYLACSWEVAAWEAWVEWVVDKVVEVDTQAKDLLSTSAEQFKNLVILNKC